MLTFGLFVVAASRVFGTLLNERARNALMTRYNGLIIFVGWSLVMLGALLHLING
jgi:hypothetical protein